MGKEISYNTAIIKLPCNRLNCSVIIAELICIFTDNFLLLHFPIE